MASNPRCSGSCPTQKTSCWRSAPTLGLLITPFQIVHLNDPVFIPCSTVQKNILFLALPTHQRQIKNLVPFLISHMKGLFHFQDINLESRPHNHHGNHLTQCNNHTRLLLWGDLVLLKNLRCVDLRLVMDHSNYYVEWQVIVFHLNCERWELLKNTNILVIGKNENQEEDWRFRRNLASFFWHRRKLSMGFSRMNDAQKEEGEK